MVKVSSNGKNQRGTTPAPSKKQMFTSPRIAKKKPKALKKIKAKRSQSSSTTSQKSNSGSGTPKKPSIRFEESKEYLIQLYDSANKRMEKQKTPASLNRQVVKGYDMNKGVNYSKIFSTYINTGF